MGKISNYNRSLRKRLIIILPISLLILFVILYTMEHLGMTRKFFKVGYRGPEKPVPRISIQTESEEKDRSFLREKNPLSVKQVILPREEEKEVDQEGKKPENPPLQSHPEDLEIETPPGESYYRSYESHADIPYQQDYVILKMVQPDYPQSAIELGLEGYVVVEAYISEEGRVKDAYVRSVYGPPSFEESSLEAVRQFRFKPMIMNGEPTTFWVSFLIKFNFRSPS